MKALEAVGEAYVGGLLVVLTIFVGVAWSKRALLQKVKRARR